MSEDSILNNNYDVMNDKTAGYLLMIAFKKLPSEKLYTQEVNDSDIKMSLYERQKPRVKI